MLKTCNEPAKFIINWGGINCNYCPAHANQLVTFGQTVGLKVDTVKIPKLTIAYCQSCEPLTEHEEKHNRDFKD